MFESLKRLFSDSGPRDDEITKELAVAALLVHLAAVDGEVAEAERETIRIALEQKFDLSGEAVRKLIAEATHQDAEAVDFYKFTSHLIQLDEKERIGIIELMWQVVFADNENHELEDNMVWRVAELIGVSSRQRTILRNRMKRAAEKGQ